ncbi:hypothetical protein B0T09DRAFT_394589 [Sordaria sp. MPI-SDFR-AT-0083]|nr:hypothetical protein B0T09DRAFT_394589 [Sordaria sp. MPI-SDFR-AT-0083]
MQIFALEALLEASEPVDRSPASKTPSFCRTRRYAVHRQDSLSDWTYFENLLEKPDAEYEIAYCLFDVERLGTVKYDDVRRVYEPNKRPDSIPFDWDCKNQSLPEHN